VRETCDRGVIAGYHLTDIRVAVIDGKYHTVDSSEYAFKTAGIALARASRSPSRPARADHDAVGGRARRVRRRRDGNFSRRGRVLGVERAVTRNRQAHVPMAEVLTYASDLTSDRWPGQFRHGVLHYEETPAAIQDRIVAEAQVPARGGSIGGAPPPQLEGVSADRMRCSRASARPGASRTPTPARFRLMARAAPALPPPQLFRCWWRSPSTGRSRQDKALTSLQGLPERVIEPALAAKVRRPCSRGARSCT
jgi:hypothetical protein